MLLAGKLTAGTLEAVRDCIGEMMKQMPLKQCGNCKASNPTIRRCELECDRLLSPGLNMGAYTSRQPYPTPSAMAPHSTG